VEEWNSGKSFQFSFNPEAEDRPRDKGIKFISISRGKRGEDTLIEASKAP
jgi:hypothetical protein